MRKSSNNPETRTQGHSSKKINVIVLAKSNFGSYIDILYTLLEKNYNVKSINLSNFSLKRLIKTLSQKPIIHIHWIEHKYTFGQINSFGKYSKYSIIPGAIIFLLTMVIFRLFFSFPIVTTLHNLNPHHIIFPAFERSIFKITLSISRLVYVHTDKSVQKATALYGIKKRKIVKIPHGNWGVIRKKTWDYDSARKRLGVKNDTFVMCFIGRISPDKGTHLLLNAIKDININQPLCLIVAGTPINKEYCDYISNEINKINNLRILYYPRWISESELELFIEASDVGIIPYVKTSTPASALLFMSFGKPVIVPSLPEVKEFIGTDYPLLYDGTHCDLKKSIIKGIFEVDLKQLGEKSKKRSLLFDWDFTTLYTYRSYRKILNRT